MTSPFRGRASLSAAPRAHDDRPRRRWFAWRRGNSSGADSLQGAGHWLSMDRDATCRIANVREFPLYCREGRLWVTYPEYPGDTVLTAGERLVLTSRSTILIVAIEPASIWVSDGFAVDHAEDTRRSARWLRTK